MSTLPRRHSSRLPGYDYSTGVFFITICTHQQIPLFGAIADGRPVLTSLGRLVTEEWHKTAILRAVGLGEFVVMPNHFHAIVSVGEATAVAMEGSGASIAPLRSTPNSAGIVTAPITAFAIVRGPSTLGSLVAGFKSAVTSRARRELAWDRPVWQRNYHEHVVRNEADLTNIQQYISSNPANWSTDRYYTSSEFR